MEDDRESGKGKVGEERGSEGAIIISDADPDGSGEISFEEFAGALKEEPRAGDKEQAVQPSTNGPRMVDLDGHNGLRGLIALHVCLGHLFLYSTWRTSLSPGVPMPWFYMLSGFSLSVTYAKSDLKDLGRCGTYLQNRAARILPVHYLCQLIALPLTWLGYCWIPAEAQVIVPTVLANIGFFSTWFIIFHPWGPPGFSGPAWTISTLAFFWLLFPSVMKRARELPCATPRPQNGAWAMQKLLMLYTPASLDELVLWCNQASFLVGSLVFWVPVFGGYWSSTAWPVSRLPVFVTGVAAGLICVKRLDEPGNDDASNACCILPGTMDAKSWGRRVDLNCLAYVLIMVVCHAVQGFVDTGISMWGQLIFVHLFLEVTTGMTYATKDSSYVARLCRTGVCQYFGQICMCLYLIHEPLVQYTCAIYYGTPPAAHWNAKTSSKEYPTDPPTLAYNCTMDPDRLQNNGTEWQSPWDERSQFTNGRPQCTFFRLCVTYNKAAQSISCDCLAPLIPDFSLAQERGDLLPPQYIPAVLSAALILAALMEKLVEAPARRFLRAKSPGTRRSRSPASTAESLYAAVCHPQTQTQTHSVIHV